MRHGHNLATEPQANHRPFLAVTTIFGALGLIALLFLSRAALVSWRSSRELRADTARLESQIRSDRQRQQELQTYFRSADARGILDRSEFLNSLIDGRSFPWTRVFMDLGETLPPGARVVSIEPKLVNGRAEVALKVGMATDDAKIAFLRAIEKSKAFSGLLVKEERRSNQPSAADKIELSLTVWYSTT